MLSRKVLATLAASAALVCAGVVRAAEPTAALTSSPLYLQDAPETAPAAETARKPLMALLDAAHIAKPLDDLGINIYGYVEGSWTYASHNYNSNGSPIPGRAFDTNDQSPLFNQLDLTIERTVDLTKGKFDIGFRIEQIYGADSRFIHSNGLTIYSPSKIGYPGKPRNQYDLNQAYLDFAIPLGKGLDIRVGKFNTLLGYEVISPTGNAFYSHAFLFTELPFTHTGLLASYNVTDSLAVTGGFTRGWDQATDDVNDDIDYTGQIKYTADKLTFYLNAITGREVASDTPRAGGGTRNGWRTVFDFIASYQYSDNLTLAVNADYGFEAQADPVSGDYAQWYGAAVYAGFKLSDMFTINARGEFFDDNDGGAPTSYTGSPNNMWEATLGLAIKPFPNSNIGSNLVIRPEVRVDYSDKSIFSGTNSQITAAIEAYFAF